MRTQTRFRVSCKMVKQIHGNYPDMYRRRGIPLTCPTCPPATVAPGKEEAGPRDTQVHVMTACEEFTDMREGMDFSKDNDIAEFFKKVTERGMDLEDIERT